MRRDVVKFYHRQLSFINEAFHYISLPKTIELFLCFFNAAVTTIRIQVYDQFVLEPLKQKSQCDTSVTRTFATFRMFLTCDNLIILITNFSKRCG